MSLLFLSFFAGLLTVLAPCILPVLPVVIGGSITDRNPIRPLIITLSLGVSIVAFTLLLKVSTIFVDIPQSFWKNFSGSILVFFGVILVFPLLWEKISIKLKFSNKSQQALAHAGQKKGIWGMILIGMSLGPVFASCSPVYFIILATVLPASFLWGLTNLIAYALGLSVIMFLIGYLGQKAVAKARWAANPHGAFRKILGALFLIVGLTILMSWDKAAESWLLDRGFNVTRVEESLLKKFEITEQKSSTSEKTTENPEVQTETQEAFPFTEKYQAPELSGLENWINSDGYTSMEDLKGKVVLVDFWTYSCINCIRTLPYLQELHEKYADQGLVILGIHAPEFAFEKKLENVKEATQKFGLTYPVVQDNDFKTWRNYENHYWPAKYLIDREGFVRYHHFGEGKYEETEKAVAALLETDIANAAQKAQTVNFSNIKTPETYLGTRRRENKKEADQELALNEWKLTGSWEEDGESVFADEFPSSIFLHFSAAKANLVMGGNATAEIYIDSELSQTITVGMEQLYNVADFGKEYGEHKIEIRFTEGKNVKLYAWTFG